MNKEHIKSFRINNIILAADAHSRLNELLAQKNAPKDFVDTIIRKIERDHLQNGKLTGVYLETIVAELDESIVTGKAVVSFVPVELEKIPILRYNQALKCFEPRHDQPKMFGNASDKIRMHQDRYNLVIQRILRNPLWNQTSVNRGAAKLTSIESLQGTVHEHFIFGFLSQVKEGEFYLEDSNSRVRLDLSQITEEKMSAGVFTEGCLVICKGIQVDEKFVVDSLYMPPPESSEETEKNFPGVDFFGNSPSQKVLAALEEWENTRDETSIYILSDVWLDSEKVIRSLKLMFARFNDNGVIPDVMIFCGNFMSRDYGQHFSDFETVKSNFRELADIIAQFPKIANSTHFVFVPGHADTGIPVFPYQPISKVFRTALEEKLKHAHFPANPCRLRFGSKTILVYRDNIVNTLRRNCVIPPKDMGEEYSLQEHVVTTLACQSHLNPLSEKPIIWNFDHAMHLYPLPDVVVLADHYEHYELVFHDCLFLNPGSFNIDTSFISYNTIQEEAEFFSIDDH